MKHIPLYTWTSPIGLLLIVIGGIVLFGWTFNLNALTDLFANLEPMKPNTALSFVLVGLALYANEQMLRPSYQRLIQVCGLLVGFIGLATLSQYFSGYDLGIDRLFFQIKADPRMSPAAAFGFALLGGALVLVAKRAYYTLTQIMACTVFAIGLLAFAAYLFDAASLYANPPFNAMAIRTSLSFCIAGMGILVGTSKHGIMAEIARHHLGGVMARRLLPIVVSAPLVIGWLRLQGQYLGLYDPLFGLALFALSNVFLLTAVVWVTARLLNKIDAKNHQVANRMSAYAHRMELLHTIDRGIINAQATSILADGVLRDLRRLIPCERLSISVVDEATQEMVIYAVNTTFTESLLLERMPIVAGMFSGFDRQRTRYVDDLRTVQDEMPVVGRLIEQGLACLLQVLMVIDEQPIGLLSLSSTTHRFFTDDHREIAIEVADQVAIAIHQMRLSEALRQANNQLEQRVVERTTELMAAKEQVEAILNNSNEAILLSDSDLRIQRANPAFDKLFGRDQKVYTLASLLDLVQPENRPAVQAYIRSVRPGIPAGGLELRARREDGSIMDVDVSIAQIEGDGFVSTLHDITQRKLVERQLLYHASLQNTVADAVIVTDLEYRIQSWNRAAERIYGWKADEVIGKPAREVLQSEFSSAQFAEELQQVFIDNGHWSGEVRQQRRDGTSIYVLSSTVLFRDFNDLPVGVLAVNHDITERKRIEDTLQNALKREIELNEMKTRFISVASHEFRTPLATILMATESVLAYRHRMQPAQIDEKLDRIRQQVAHLTAIMDDVLQSARMQGNHIEFNPIKDNLDRLCREIVQELVESDASFNRIQYACENPNALTRFDRRLMRQIIVNLLSNALKYSPPDSSVQVRLSQQDDQISLMVQDCGIGIPAKDVERVFEPFYRAGNVGEVSGTGLGMNITKNAVDKHGGTIHITSEVGSGTMVTVSIPMHNP